MTNGQAFVPSASQVNRAGRTLRHFSADTDADPSELDLDKAELAIGVLVAYRAAHQRPLTKANMGLRSMVHVEGCRQEISQRLKRIPTILDKLHRYPNMALGTMQDIGGCRAVLGSVDEIYRVQARLMRRRPVIRVTDYIVRPRDSGYRGVHVIVTYGDAMKIDRCIEVQLRTPAMHDWAITIERLSGRLKEDLKSGQGPRAVLYLMEAISEAMALEESGQEVDTRLQERIDSLRPAAIPFLTGGSTG